MSRHGRWLLLVLLTIVAAACGSDSSDDAATNGATTTTTTSSESSTTTEAVATDDTTSPADGLCSVFPEELALAALGQPIAEVEGGEVIPRPNGIYCRHSAADGNINVDAQLSEKTRSDFDSYVAAASMTEPLDGVGEVAFQINYEDFGGEGASVAAYAEGRRVIVTLQGVVATPEQLDALVTMARTALES